MYKRFLLVVYHDSSCGGDGIGSPGMAATPLGAGIAEIGTEFPMLSQGLD